MTREKGDAGVTGSRTKEDKKKKEASYPSWKGCVVP